jgi:hypothetical protein
MAHDDSNSPREALIDALMEKVREDPYPSSTMLDIVEGLLRPEEVRPYAEVLLDKVRNDRFPSISMIQRLQALS